MISYNMFRYSVDIPEFGKVTVKITTNEITEKKLKQYFSTYFHLQRFQNNNRYFPLIGSRYGNRKWKLSPEDYEKMFLYELNNFINQLKFASYAFII